MLLFRGMDASINACSIHAVCHGELEGSSKLVKHTSYRDTVVQSTILIFHHSVLFYPRTCFRRCCPYGGFLAVPVIVTLFATLFTWAATFNCSFYFIDDSRGVGLWTVQGPTAFFGDHVCYGWDDSFQSAGLSLDTPMRFARGLSLPASLASLYIFTSMLISSCTTMPARFIKSITFTMFLLGLLCILCLVRLLICLLVLDMAWARVNPSSIPHNTFPLGCSYFCRLPWRLIIVPTLKTVTWVWLAFCALSPRSFGSLRVA